MRRESKPPSEEDRIRCPRLGHQVPFSYCRSENKGLPCFKTLDCWYEVFLVEAFLQKELTPDQWGKAFKRPKTTKLLSLVELIQQAKKRQEETT